MTYTKITECALLIISLYFTGMLLNSKDAVAAGIDWQKYMQSSANVSAISAAVAWVDGCSKKPLLIEELKPGEGKVLLTFTCDGNEDERATAIIEFNSYGNGNLFPKKFDFAG